MESERADCAEALVDTKAGLLAAERASSFSLALEKSAYEERLKRQVSHAVDVSEHAKEWYAADGMECSCQVVAESLRLELEWRSDSLHWRNAQSCIVASVSFTLQEPACAYVCLRLCTKRVVYVVTYRRRSMRPT